VVGERRGIPSEVQLRIGGVCESLIVLESMWAFIVLPAARILTRNRGHSLI
jgi:hypothetical protein